MTLVEGSVGVEDLVLLEPVEQESLLRNLQLRYEKKEIYVRVCGCPWLWACGWSSCARVPPKPPLYFCSRHLLCSRPTLGTC